MIICLRQSDNPLRGMIVGLRRMIISLRESDNLPAAKCKVNFLTYGSEIFDFINNSSGKVFEDS